MPRVHRVTFVGRGATASYDVTHGGTLLRAALRARLPLARACRGVAVCAACKVRVLDGADHLAPPTAAEAALAAREPLAPDERYACQAHVLGPVRITTSYW